MLIIFTILFCRRRFWKLGYGGISKKKSCRCDMGAGSMMVEEERKKNIPWLMEWEIEIIARAVSVARFNDWAWVWLAAFNQLFTIRLNFSFSGKSRLRKSKSSRQVISFAICGRSHLFFWPTMQHNPTIPNRLVVVHTLTSWAYEHVEFNFPRSKEKPRIVFGKGAHEPSTSPSRAICRSTEDVFVFLSRRFPSYFSK